MVQKINLGMKDQAVGNNFSSIQALSETDVTNVGGAAIPVLVLVAAAVSGFVAGAVTYLALE